jgi:hypothetical protein
MIFRRKGPLPEDRQKYAREVLEALEEGRRAQRNSGVAQKSWPLPVGALFALQKAGCVFSPPMEHSVTVLVLTVWTGPPVGGGS